MLLKDHIKSIDNLHWSPILITASFITIPPIISCPLMKGENNLFLFYLPLGVPRLSEDCLELWLAHHIYVFDETQSHWKMFYWLLVVWCQGLTYLQTLFCCSLFISHHRCNYITLNRRKISILRTCYRD